MTGGLPIVDLDLDNLQAEKGFLGLRTYSHAKRALEAMTLELSRELAPRGIHVNVVYPGNAPTAMSGQMTLAMIPWWMVPVWPIFRLLMQSDDGGRGAEKASRSSVWAATTDELASRGGGAFDTDCRPMKLKRNVADPAIQARVVAIVRELAKMPPLAEEKRWTGPVHSTVSQRTSS
ncbi:hypothetical protein BH09MYX1_BH09MYX1_23530 [soil metagenome]